MLKNGGKSRKSFRDHFAITSYNFDGLVPSQVIVKEKFSKEEEHFVHGSNDPFLGKKSESCFEDAGGGYASISKEALVFPLTSHYKQGLLLFL